MAVSFRSRFILLEQASELEEVALVLVRVATGVFLVHEVWDNIISAERMAKFASFMEASGFSRSDFWAPFSVYTQFVAGLLAILGLCTRWAGLIIAVTFLVALYSVHWDQGLRDWWPALSLVLVGAMLGTRGGGCLSIDAMLSD